MEDILVKIPEIFYSLIGQTGKYSYLMQTQLTRINDSPIVQVVSLRELFSLIDELDGIIEAKNEMIRDLKNKENEPDYKDEVIAEQRIEERIVMGR